MLDKDVQKSPETVSAKAGNTAQDYAFTENEGTHEETSSEHVTEEHDGLETPTPNAEAEVDKYDKRTSADIGTGDQFVVSREGAALDVQGKAFYSSASVTEELGVDAAEAFAEPNEENDATRCKGVAERLAKMGAFNPLSAPHRQTSITPRDSPVESEAVPLPIAPSHLPEVPGQGNLRKGSVDSAASNSRLLEMPDLRDSNIGPQNVFPYPPHAEHSRTSSLHSTVSKAEDESQDGEY
jgi:hypothetical protein